MNTGTIEQKREEIKKQFLQTYELDEKFQTTFSNLISNEKLQNELGTQIKKLAKPNATKEIVNEIIKLIKKIKS